MTKRKIQAMHERFGTCGVLQCRGCCHLISGDYHDRRYHKCELYGLSHSEATDWRLSYQACGMYNIEVDIEHWNPILQQIIREPKSSELPLEGQTVLNI